MTDPERALILSYAPAQRSAELAALFSLDDSLGGALRASQEPLLVQMRLTWWHGELFSLGEGARPADPVLAGLIDAGLATRGSELAAMIEGWEALLEPELDDAALDLFARARGSGLFTIAGGALEATHPTLADAGRGWALVDLARHCGDPRLAERALAMARTPLARALEKRWPVRLRALGAMAALASRGMEPVGTPRRMLRALRHRLTGR